MKNEHEYWVGVLGNKEAEALRFLVVNGVGKKISEDEFDQTYREFMDRIPENLVSGVYAKLWSIYTSIINRYQGFDDITERVV